jgi:copper(I)-binding protein
MSHRIVTRTAVVGLTLALASGLIACGSSSGSITTADAWARPGSTGAETAAYLTITNTGTAADTLVSASSPSATSVEIHETTTDASGMMGMHPIDGIEIPAGGSVTLEPGGKHLMVMGLTTDLAVGGTLDVDLVFENAGTVKVKAEVKQP